MIVNFAESYPAARGRFLEAVDTFEAHNGRRCVRARHAIIDAEELTVDVAHFEPRDGRRLLLLTSGVHGIEGYAGNAIQRALLGGPLARLAGDCGVLLVHAVNPWGMAHFRRVNPNNVDLNRNFAEAGDTLYQTRNPGYRLIAGALAPRGPCEGALASQAQLLGELSAAALRNGYATLKQALLAGQYESPEGLFYGGAEPQREVYVFGALFDPLCTRYDEILLIDLHTGYGARGQVQLLRSVADPQELIDPKAERARGPNSRTQGYFVTGDLVAFCHLRAKHINPSGIFDGVVVEIGTTGLSMWTQLRDLETMVRENQLHRHGARSSAVERAVKASFRELFHPTDPAWQRDALAAALTAIEDLIARRGYLAAA